jgi:LmbE family N-acetylglucosaminyl deacetylase
MLYPRRVQRLLKEIILTALLLAPHNDDETLFAFFTLCRERPHVVVCLQSRKQESESYPGGYISAGERETETDLVMSLLELLPWTQLSHQDISPDWRAVEESLIREKLRHDPTTVFAPAIEEGGHEQHNEIGRIALRVFGADNVVPYLTYTQNRIRSTGREVVPEPDWIRLKFQALACYESQIRSPATRKWFIDDPIREYVP